MIPSENRRVFNEEMLPRFIKMLSPHSTVLDIGKSQSWGDYYKDVFKDFSYKTADINGDVNPDFVLNVEAVRQWDNKVDAAIIMGVTEQAKNPFDLVNGVYHLLKPSGLALFGICSVAFPIYSTDLTRFTPKGALNLLNIFSIIEERIVLKNEVPEYLFYIVEKPQL